MGLGVEGGWVAQENGRVAAGEDQEDGLGGEQAHVGVVQAGEEFGHAAFIKGDGAPLAGEAGCGILGGHGG